VRKCKKKREKIKEKPQKCESCGFSIDDDNINIENMLNKSKGDNAYTLIDVCGELTEEIADELKAVEGIIRVTIYKA